MKPHIQRINPSGNSILVIDDDPNNLSVISDFLERNGFHVLVANDGESGLQKAQYVLPDLILLDIIMPGANGFEICSHLKKNPATKQIPVIFMTALTQTIEKIKGFEVGGADFITKPFQQEEVLARIQTHLSFSEMQTKLKKNNNRLKKEFNERRQAEKMVRKLNDKLEQKVERRTSDLKKANTLLRKEIVERKTIENKLRESEQRYRTLTTHVADGIILVQNEELLYANNAFMQMSGYSNLNQLTGKNIFDLISDGFSESYKKINLRIKPSHNKPQKFGQITEIFQGICKSKGGRKFWVEGHASLIKWEDEIAVLCTISDINKRMLEEIAHHEHAENLQKENIKLRNSIKERFRFGDIIGKSQAMQKVYELIISAASSDANVIIYGESGTGKELVAKAIHNMSPRSDKALVTVNCQAIPESLLESSFFGHKKGAFTGAHADKLGFLTKADGGDLFLDEVADINLGMQGKLLRAIEGGGYSPLGADKTCNSNFRVIAATNKNMKEAIKKGTMREDFYYRIHIVPIWLPRLRERKEDIQLLVHHFLSIFSKGKKPAVLPVKYMDAIYNYNWPGNVRELQNVLQRYITIGNLDFFARHQYLGESVNIKQNSPEILQDSKMNFKQKMASFEKEILLEALNKTNWNRNKTLKLLDIPRRTLYHKMKKFELI